MDTDISHVSSKAYELNSIVPSSTTSVVRPPAQHYYEIEYKLLSEPSTLFFTRDISTNEQIVMKLLSSYKDTRYSLETVEKRQQSQLEALHWNKTFTSDLYIGLGRIHGFDAHLIVLDEIMERPTKEMLDPTVDYVLLMRRLPNNRRLDYLLNEKNFQRFVYVLAKWVAHMHENLEALPSLDGDRIQWGSCEQLRSKLQHNLELSNLLLIESRNVEYSIEDWLKGILGLLKETLPQVFTQNLYQQYFERRRQEQRIKRCHGDLRVKHIWIAANDLTCNKELWQYLQILDAIDLIPLYSHIDILSDFAMLVVDIQAYTDSPTFADLLIEEYLHLTQQEDKIARAVLDYYLVEKALVSAIVHITYEHLLIPGLALLRVAEMRLEMVKFWLGTQHPT